MSDLMQTSPLDVFGQFLERKPEIPIGSFCRKQFCFLGYHLMLELLPDGGCKVSFWHEGHSRLYLDKVRFRLINTGGKEGRLVKLQNGEGLARVSPGTYTLRIVRPEEA